MNLKNIVITGRPNVGKSTLFNQLIRKKKSIVYDRPGVTRDCVEEVMQINQKKFNLIDTGGLDKVEGDDDIQRKVQSKIDEISKKADAFLIVVDARHGLSSLDVQSVNKIRKYSKPMILVLNKLDPGFEPNNLDEFKRLGILTILEVSSEHRLGLETVMEVIEQQLLKDVKPFDEADTDGMQMSINIAVVGRPNVGKSSIINALIKEEKMIVSSVAGTTRETIDTELMHMGVKYTLLDTAGLRKSSKINEDLEYYSSLRTKKAIENCHVVVLMIDSIESISTQDQKIAAMVVDMRRGMLVLVNKWDLVKDSQKDRKDFRDELFYRAPFLKFADVKFVSAKSKMGMDSVLPACKAIFNRMRRSFTQDELEHAYKTIAQADTIRASHGHVVTYKRLSYIPKKIATFYVRCNRPDWVSDDIKNHWKNVLFDLFDMRGVPIKITFHRNPLKESKAKHSA